MLIYPIFFSHCFLEIKSNNNSEHRHHRESWNTVVACVIVISEKESPHINKKRKIVWNVLLVSWEKRTRSLRLYERWVPISDRLFLRPPRLFPPCLLPPWRFPPRRPPSPILTHFEFCNSTILKQTLVNIGSLAGSADAGPGHVVFDTSAGLEPASSWAETAFPYFNTDCIVSVENSSVSSKS